jgi:hypothetical protein
MSRLRPSAANVDSRQINDLANNGIGETMEGEWSTSYPVTLYFSYAIPLQNPLGYPTPLLPLDSLSAS